MMIDQSESVPCNICGAVEYDVVYPAGGDAGGGRDAGTTYRSSGDDVLVDQLVKCRACGLVYVNPRPHAGKILDGYAEGADEQFVSQVKGREITFEKSLRRIERFAAVGRILDVGTAGGSFLHVARGRGWEVAGCEPNRWLCRWSKEHYGLDVMPGTVHDQHYPGGHFDVVTLWDVLEHVADPKSELVEVSRILRKGGLLVVNYPDIESLAARALGRKWPFLLNVHLYYFTRGTVTRILRDSGYDVLKTGMHFQKLSLGYILSRVKPYFGFVHAALDPLVRRLGLDAVQVPYWLGQTLVIARKR